jgi:hypothetical protein
MNARGDALVAWRVDTGRGCPVRAAFRRAGGAWSRPLAISGVRAFCEGGNHRVAIDERGDAVVVWFEQRGTRTFVRARSRAAGGRWGAAETLATARTVLRPEVGMDARGDTVVAWWAEGREWSRSRARGGRWQPAQAVSGLRVTPASLAVDPRGDELLAWREGDGIRVASRPSAAGRWQSSLVASGPGTSAATPTASIDGAGDGAVGWDTEEGLHTVFERAGG